MCLLTVVSIAIINPPRLFTLMCKIPTRIRKHQRVIQTIGIAVVVLGVAGGLDIRVGAEETLKVGVVQTTIHIYQTKTAHMLVPRVTTVKTGLHGGEVASEISKNLYECQK
jgi:hypothetical protein